MTDVAVRIRDLAECILDMLPGEEDGAVVIAAMTMALAEVISTEPEGTAQWAEMVYAGLTLAGAPPQGQA